VSHLPGGRVYVATGYGMPATQVTRPEAVRLLREVLDRFSAPHIVALRERLTNDQEVNARPYEWLLLDPPWHDGRIVVIGDAAHATTDHLTSMGGMAIEDGVVLAQELARHEAVPDALAEFQSRRTERLRALVATSVELLRMQLEDADLRSTAAVRERGLRVLASPY
jgi:2-polyprenyl-6-methoxyphenol hydroxylase-like FAD-dependent oxidoreductase